MRHVYIQKTWIMRISLCRNTTFKEACVICGLLGTSAVVSVVKMLSENTTYILNLSKMKIHLPNCSAVTEIAFDNLEESDVSDLQLLVDQGYEACFRCIPLEKQKD